jgi:hypothetical protein
MVLIRIKDNTYRLYVNYKALNDYKYKALCFQIIYFNFLKNLIS